VGEKGAMRQWDTDELLFLGMVGQRGASTRESL